LLYDENMNQDFEIFYNDEEYTKPILFHSHDFYEIYFFDEGSVRYYVEDEEYEMKKGDVLIIPPGKLHRPVIESGMRYRRYVLWIYDSFVRNNEGVGFFVEELNRLIDLKRTRLIHLKAINKDELWKKLWTIYELSDDNRATKYVRESKVILVLNDLTEALTLAEISEQADGDMIKEVISYLNDNFIDAPSLDELAQRFFVSKYYLCHSFKDYTRTSIHSYILMKKINYAKELLKSGLSPKNVSERCGFTTYSNFYKSFMNITGVSPGRFER